MLSAQQSIALIATGLLAATFGSSVVRADTSCKGLAADQCSNQATCLWVNAYTRKDGRTVQGYCRNKGGKTMSMTDRDTSAGPTPPVGKDTVRIPTTANAAKVKQGG